MGPAYRDAARHEGRFQDRLDEAERLLREALAIRQRLFGDRHPDTATSRHNLGLVALDRGALAVARRELMSALESRLDKLGAEHWQVGNSLTNVAKVDLAAGDPCAAVAHAARAEVVIAASLPADHWRLGEARSVLGAALVRRGDRVEGERLLAVSLAAIVAAKDERSRAVRDARARFREAGKRQQEEPIPCQGGDRNRCSGPGDAEAYGGCLGPVGPM